MRKAVMVLLLCAAAAMAQKTPLAVYVSSIDPGASDLIGSLRERLNDAINKSDDYRAVARSENIWATLDKEHDIQMSKRVKAEDIADAFSATGAPIVCVIEIRKAFGIYELSAKILDIQTKEYLEGRSTIVESPLQNMNQFKQAVDDIVDGLNLIKANKLKRETSNKMEQEASELAKREQALKAAEAEQARKETELAQQKPNSGKDGKRFRMGLKLASDFGGAGEGANKYAARAFLKKMGIPADPYSIASLSSVLQEAAGPAFKGGVGLSANFYNVAPQLDIVTEINFVYGVALWGSTYSGYDGSADADIFVGYSALDVPILARYRMGSVLYLEGGLQFGLPLFSEAAISGSFTEEDYYSGYGNITYPVDENISEDFSKGVDLGMTLGAGLAFGDFTIGFRVNIGFTPFDGKGDVSPPVLFGVNLNIPIF